jgi:hypothetical protein
VVHLPKLHEKYGDRVQFLFVYVREVRLAMEKLHAFPEALRPFEEPAGAPLGSRLRLTPRVRAGREHFHLRFPCLIDNEHAEVEALYNAWPARLFIVDAAGRIALDSSDSAPGPFPWAKITDWLDRYGESISPRPAQKRG